MVLATLRKNQAKGAIVAGSTMNVLQEQSEQVRNVLLDFYLAVFVEINHCSFFQKDFPFHNLCQEPQPVSCYIWNVLMDEHLLLLGNGVKALWLRGWK